MAQEQVQQAGGAHEGAAKAAHRGKKKDVAKKAVPQKKEPGKQVAVHQPAPPPAPTSMLAVISQAVMDPRCDVEKMKALLDMQERIETRDSQKAFTVAFNALQAELPIINRDGKIDHSAEGTSGTTKSGRKALQTKYATYPNLNRVVGPLLKKHGFTFSSAMEPEPSGAMVVTSTLEHVGGHSRTTHFRVTADATGGKNNQQGWGSSQQYGMRYNMIALLNIVTEAKEDADNDGFPKDGPISEAQLKELIKLADDAGADKAKFCAVMGVEALAEIPQSRFAEAKQQLQRKLKQKKSQQSDFPGDR
jgi:hypothetical protein